MSHAIDALGAYPFEKLSHLLEGITPSSTYPLSDLTIGEPKFQTPTFIQDALKANSHLLNKYPPALGTKPLNEAILDFIKRRFGVACTPNQVTPTLGSKEACFNFPLYVLMQKTKPHIAITNPLYQVYKGSSLFNHAQITYLDLDAQNNFKPQVSKEQLQSFDLVILNTPHNPTGSVMDLDELGQWVDWALAYDFVLMSDECYSEIYIHEPPCSLLEASVAVGNRAFKNVVVLNSLSKRSSAPGLRSGFVAGDEALLMPYKTLRSYLGSTPPLPNQHAATKAWLDDDHVEIFRQKYKANFAYARSVLGDQIYWPKAGFFVWLGVPFGVCGGDDLEFAKQLYVKHHIKVLPGQFMGQTICNPLNGQLDNPAKGFVRLALVYELQDLKRPLQVIGDILQKGF